MDGSRTDSGKRLVRFDICAVGRLRAGPELDLFSDYVGRFDKTGRALGFGPLKLNEVDGKRNQGRKNESDQLERSAPVGTVLCALDERGKTLTSPEFASQVSRWQDHGRSGITFLIGGADGIAPGLVAKADLTLSFGKMVWPHMLARVMLAEQLYRVATIMANKPYHRI